MARKTKGRLVAFQASDELFAQLASLAQQYGFNSPALYVRAVVEKHLATPDAAVALHNVFEIRHRIRNRVMRDVAALFAAYTESDFEDAIEGNE